MGFASKLKVLNQFTFKKSIKVPNKLNPCMGIPKHNPNVSILYKVSKAKTSEIYKWEVSSEVIKNHFPLRRNVK